MHEHQRDSRNDPLWKQADALQTSKSVASTGLLHLIDDDDPVYEQLKSGLVDRGIKVFTYSTAREFLEAYTPAHSECVIAEVNQPGMSGIDLLDQLIERKLRIPIILVTADIDVLLVVRAIKRGAYDFIKKPLNAQMLMPRIIEAMAMDAKTSEEDVQLQIARSHLATLSDRERVLLQLLAEGLSSKQVAIKLSISVKTVSNHRSHLLAKMNAANTAELIRLTVLCEK